MAKVRVELNSAGVRDLLQSREMKACIKEYVDRIQRNCGNEYSGTVQVGKTRVQGRVETNTEHAYYSNLKRNTLLKGLR